MAQTKKELIIQLEHYKNVSKNLLAANDELSIAIQQALEEKEEWFEHADKAHKEQEALVAVVKDLVDDTINNLINVEANIGSISVLDVIYNIGIIERVVEAKFNPKTKEL